MIQPSAPEQVGHFAVLAAGCADCSMTPDQLQTYQRRHGLWSIYDTDQVIVGFIAGRTVLDEAELDQILIDPAFRQRGFAAQGLQHWHEYVRTQGIRWVFLEVREHNEPAVRLYGHLGYEVMGRRHNYYRRPEASGDALMMKKTL